MEGFLNSILSHEPGYKSDVFFAPAHLMLALQYAGTENVLNAALSRLESDTEASVQETMCILLNLTISDPAINPDAIDNAIDQSIEFGLKHPSFKDGHRWIAAFLHYHSSNELAVAQMSDSGATDLATQMLTANEGNAEVVAAACLIFSHFNGYGIGSGIKLITEALVRHHSHRLAAKTATRAIAEFTSFWGGGNNNAQSAKYAAEFIEYGGMAALFTTMEIFPEEEVMQLSCVRILSNLGSGEHVSALASKQCSTAASNAALKFSGNEMLVSHALHALANIPLDTDYYDKVIVEAAVSAMKVYPKVELIQTEATRVFGTLATLVKDSKAHMAEKRAVAMVILGLKEHPKAAMLHQEAFNVFSYLAFDSEMTTQEITRSGGIELVVDAMARFTDNESLLTTACAALSGLTYNNTAGQNIVLQHNGIGVVLAAMQRSSRERLVEMGCLAVGTMCWNVELKADVVKKGGIQGMLSALERFRESTAVVKNAVRALAQIAFNSENFRDEMSRLNAIPSIIEIMRHHVTHDRVQMHGCVALSYLSWTNERNAKTIVGSGGYDVIIKAMTNHPTNPEVQEHACRALANISAVINGPADEAIAGICEAMRKHERVSEVQEEACRAIVTLSLIGTSNKDKLSSNGAAASVVNAVRAFPRNNVVQQEGCNALAHLAYEHSELNKEVTRLGGVELLLASMSTFPNNVKVQLNACGGLSALAFDNPTAQRQIYDSEGVVTVIQAMRTFDKLRILELGCSVLGTLAWNPDIKEKVAVIAIPEILRAMRAHLDNPLLQKSTCRAISQFAFNSEVNRKLLYEAKAIPHIVTAVKTHLETEKLVSHAIVALTYLCWENAEVAQSIIDEGTIDLLHKIESTYASREKIANKAVHLLKILGRKVSPQASPVQHKSPKQGGGGVSLLSPPQESPQPGMTMSSRMVMSSHNTPMAPPSPSPMMRESDETDFFKHRQNNPIKQPQKVTTHDVAAIRTPPPQKERREGEGGRGGGRGGRGGRGGQQHRDPQAPVPAGDVDVAEVLNQEQRRGGRGGRGGGRGQDRSDNAPQGRGGGRGSGGRGGGRGGQNDRDYRDSREDRYQPARDDRRDDRRRDDRRDDRDYREDRYDRREDRQPRRDYDRRDDYDSRSRNYRSGGGGSGGGGGYDRRDDRRDDRSYDRRNDRRSEYESYDDRRDRAYDRRDDRDQQRDSQQHHGGGQGRGGGRGRGGRGGGRGGQN